MIFRKTGWLLLIMGSAPVLATPWGRHVPGEVRVIDGRPAICVPASAKKSFSIESVWLMGDLENANPEAASLAWELEALPHAQRIVLPPGACLTHSASLPDYIERVPFPKVLAPGHYRFRLNGQATNRTDVVTYWGQFRVRAPDGV